MPSPNLGGFLGGIFGGDPAIVDPGFSMPFNPGGEEYMMPGDVNEWQRKVDMWNNSDLAKQYNDYETNQRQLGGQAWGDTLLY
jgi:hypothetical protein